MSGSFTLGEHFESFVQNQFVSGRCNDASEALRVALPLMEEREHRLAAPDVVVERGTADIKAGRVCDLDDVCDKLDAELAALPTARLHEGRLSTAARGDHKLLLFPWR
jgi:antitoxin ParD1/3/4